MGPREELREEGRAMDGAARTGTVGSFGAAHMGTVDSLGARAGWHLDPDSGLWMRDTIHSMARRCRNWDYFGKGIYLVTIVLNDRSKPILGRLRADAPIVELTELGRRIESHFRRIPEFAPEIEVLGLQVMPEHLHGVLRVTRQHPELFRVLSDIAWKSPTDSRVLRFSAIGNRELLNASRILQVQCSRRLMGRMFPEKRK